MQKCDNHGDLLWLPNLWRYFMQNLNIIVWFVSSWQQIMLIFSVSGQTTNTICATWDHCFYMYQAIQETKNISKSMIKFCKKPDVCEGPSSPTTLWGNSYDHGSYDHTRWRTSAKLNLGRVWLWYLHATETHIICTQYRYVICRRSWTDKISDKYVILVIFLFYFPAKWS